MEVGAAAGDVEAVRIRDLGTAELRSAAQAVHRSLSFGDTPVRFVLAGGAFKACPSVARALFANPGFANADPFVLDRSPAHGAVRLALEILR